KGVEGSARFMRQNGTKLQVLSRGASPMHGAAACDGMAGFGSPVLVDLDERSAYPKVVRAERGNRSVRSTMFDDRQKGQEAKFAHDAQLRFKAEARRNKLLGIWAAEMMGLTGEEANTYAAEVVAADFAEAGDEDVFRKVSADLTSKGLNIPEATIREKMA